MAVIAGREVVVINIGDVFLNADMDPTGIVAYTILDRVMTVMLMRIDPSHPEFVEKDGTMVVASDKALYGRVELAMLLFNDLQKRLIDMMVLKRTNTMFAYLINTEKMESTCYSYG